MSVKGTRCWFFFCERSGDIRVVVRPTAEQSTPIDCRQVKPSQRNSEVICCTRVVHTTIQQPIPKLDHGNVSQELPGKKRWISVKISTYPLNIIESYFFNLSTETNFCRTRHAISHFSRGVPSQRSLRWWSKRLQLTRSCLTFWEKAGGLLVVQIMGVPPQYWWKISHCCYTFWEIWGGTSSHHPHFSVGIVHGLLNHPAIFRGTLLTSWKPPYYGKWSVGQPDTPEFSHWWYGCVAPWAFRQDFIDVSGSRFEIGIRRNDEVKTSVGRQESQAPWWLWYMYLFGFLERGYPQIIIHF